MFEQIQRLSIIGVGLIGGSLAKALRAKGGVGEIVGCSRREEHLQQAVDLGVIDRYTTDPIQAVAGADVVVVAVPLGSVEALFAAIAPTLAENTLITDVGSAKTGVVEAARRQLGVHCSRFVPGHPIAGAEKSGVSAARDDLFLGRRVIVTPVAETDAQALTRISRMWQLTGAEVVAMDMEHHDRVLAATSHLPHLLAYTLVDQLANMQTHDEIFRFAAGGFRDFTRIASSDPVMWRDICVSNREAILEMLKAFETHLSGLRQALEAQDAAALQSLFSAAKQARDAYAQASGE